MSVVRRLLSAPVRNPRLAGWVLGSCFAVVLVLRLVGIAQGDRDAADYAGAVFAAIAVLAAVGLVREAHVGEARRARAQAADRGPRP